MSLTKNKLEYVISETLVCGHMYNKNGLGSDIFWPCYKKSKNMWSLSDFEINNSSKQFGRNLDLFFNTELERQHCRDYFFTPFFSLMLAKTKRDYNIYKFMLEYIPVFNFSTPVTNERIQKEFNLTDVEMEFIEDFGKQLNGEIVDWKKYEI
jgi:hypothetical protein